MKVFKIICCLLIGGVFIYSGYTKLDPIEPFEYTFVDLGIINWQLAPFIARFFIGIEWFIGVLLILNINLNLYAYKLAKAVLIFFSVYLLLVIIILGNKGNCGCFGTYIEMTPLQALIKNVIMLVVLLFLGKSHSGWNMNIKFYKLLIITLSTTAIALPFILEPIQLNYSEAYLNKPEDHYKLELDLLYKDAELYTPPPSLSHGKHIISFMSAGCPHCRIAAKKIRIMYERDNSLPFYIVLTGNEKGVNAFFEDTHAENVPYCKLNGRSFFQLGGTSFPAIFMVNNSMVEGELNYYNLNEAEIENWLKKK